MKNYRVDIKGQFNLGNPALTLCTSSASEPFEVERNKIPTNEQPSNYNAFCDEVDTSIQQLVQAKKLHKVMGVLFVIWIIIALAPQFFMRYLNVDPSFFTYFMIFALVFIAGFALLFLKIWSTLRRVLTGDVGRICESYSISDVVTYQIRDEWWGGCNKAVVRRYYLLVLVRDSDGDGDDVEQQQQQQQGGMVQAQTGAKVDDSFQSSPPPETAPSASAPTTTTTTTGGTTSLFDQLSGTK